MADENNILDNNDNIDKPANMADEISENISNIAEQPAQDISQDIPQEPAQDIPEENMQNEAPINEPPFNAGQSFQQYNPYDPNNQYTKFKELNRQQGQYAPQYQSYQAFPQYQQPAAPKKNKAALPLTDSQKKIVTWLKIAAILIALIFVYCIISDAVGYRIHGNTNASPSPDITTPDEDHDTDDEPVIRREKKPETDENSAVSSDNSGKYTAEEIAVNVSPSIVQITAYEGGSKGSTGSGIILSENGYILTNAHVVNEYSSFEVTSYSEETYHADLVGYDSKSDLAVMHIDAEGLVPAVIGDSDELNVGESVVAIGNPAGLTNSVTKGIVSALDRQIRSGNTGFYMDCIQTDAAISPGNSGGALVNMYGQVVGVTSSKYASAYYGGTYEGLGFAISINQAIPIADELIKNGYVGGRVKIGITFASLKSDIVQAQYAEALGLEKSPVTEGIWITEISPDCDIANTELEVNDIIISVNGTKVNNYDDLFAVIQDCKAGDVLTAKCRSFNADDNGKVTAHDYVIEFELMEDTSGDY